MNIVMKDTAPGSVDGINTAIYEAGQEYDLSATAGARELAAAFVGADLAEEVGAKPALPVDTPPVVKETAAPAAAPIVTPASAKPGRKPKA